MNGAGSLLLLRAAGRRATQLKVARGHKRGVLPAEAYPSELKAKVVLDKSVKTKGHIDPYLVSASRLPTVPKGAIPIGANTTWRFFKVGMATPELYPLFGAMGFWAVITTVTVLWSFSKSDIWLDRSKKLPPWDWERERDHYYKHNYLYWKPWGAYARIPELEVLQDEMLEAARARGTR